MAHVPRIEFPVVPKSEEDPRGRINTMVAIFNENLPPNTTPTAIDLGMVFEIETAKKLVRELKVTHGKEISRSLTKAEAARGLNGNSQKIWAVQSGSDRRELDIVYKDKNIVEAKNKKVTDNSQMKKNVDLALALGGTVSYAFPITDQDRAATNKESGKTAAYKASYAVALGDRARATPAPPPLGIVSVPVNKFGEEYFDKKMAGGLSGMMTLDKLLQKLEGPN